MSIQATILMALNRELSDVQDEIARGELEAQRTKANRDLDAYTRYHMRAGSDASLKTKRAKERDLLTAIGYAQGITS